MNKEMLKVFEILNEKFTAMETIELLKEAFQERLNKAIDVEDFQKAAELNKVIGSLKYLSVNL